MNHCTAEQLIAFEDKVRDLWESGELPFLMHLAGGNEEQLIEIFREVQPGDWIFGSHRAHYHALLTGIPEAQLLDMIREGDSMFLFDRRRNFLTSSILAGTCCIACGVALALKQSGSPHQVWCFLGDGASDNGHFYEAVMYATGHDLPVTFIVENNNRQVDTDIVTRRGPDHEWFAMVSPKVREYCYVPRFPHAGSGSKHHITFKWKKP